MSISFYNFQNFVIKDDDIEYLKKIFHYVIQEFNLQEADVELEIVDSKKMKKINKKYRNIDKSTDVLSFSFLNSIQTQYIGVVYICYEEISKFSNNPFLYNLSFLFMHGVLHILGLDHGVKMSLLEQKIISNFFKN